MDDTKTVLTSLIASILLLVAGLSAHAELEYVSPEQRGDLEKLFNSSEFPAQKEALKLAGKTWSCDMFGVRSGLQVQRAVKLYSLSAPLEGQLDWHNKGAQLITDYKSENKMLIGAQGRLEDRVKLTQDGRLISQLSIVTPEKAVIAYSVCKIL